MYTIIGGGNRVNYGCIDEPVDFDYRDFALKDFFGREVKGLRKRLSFHAFNYLGIIADDFLIGIAAVNLGYAQNVFAYLYHYRKGKIFDYSTIEPGWGPLRFPVNPDEYTIRLEKHGCSLFIAKSHREGALSIDAAFGGRLAVRGNFPYSLKSHKPLRVLNPAGPAHWVFTEKCSPIVPSHLTVELDGSPLPLDPKRTALLYDWSGGYMKRGSSWYWAAFAGLAGEKGKKQHRVGLNLAALVNESFYPENAFWIDGVRTRVSRAIFDFDAADPMKPWRVFDEDGHIDITFTPMDERAEKINAVFVKSNFHQLMGTFKGTLRPAKGKALRFEGIRGFTELHRSKW